MLNKKIILLLIILILPINIFALEKHEFVYTNIDSKGNEVDKLINNEIRLKDKGTIKDETYLKNILNNNGDEKFKQDENTLLWESKGKSILYQGETDKDNPITISIKYFLDDEEVDYKDLLNKKGKITIKYNFTNTEYNSDYNLHTPFVLSLAGIFKDQSMRDITINNGKVINTGNKFVVAGIAAPGLYEDLGIDELSRFDNITINYNTDKFKMGEVYIVSTPKLLDKTDLNIFNRLDDSLNKVNLLQSGINQISNGSNKLKNGLSLYTSNFKKYSDGVNELNSGSKKLASKYKELDSGINELYNSVNGSLDSIKALEEGSKTVSDGVEELTNSNYQLYSSLLQSYNNNINQINNLSNSYNTCMNLLNTGEIDLFNENHCLQVVVGINNLEGANKTISSIFSNLGVSDMSSAEATLNYIKNNKFDKLSTGAKQVSGGNSEISSNMDKMSEGLSKLKNGSNTVSSSLDSLAQGSNKINNASKELYDGSNKLLDGINTLSKGIDTYNKSGINKLSSLSNKVKGYSYKIKQLTELSKKYNGFGSDNTTNTTFIYKINY